MARAPAGKYVLDMVAYPESSSFPTDAGHQHRVVIGLGVADRGRNGQTNCLRSKRPARGASAHPTAAARRRMTCDRGGPVSGTPRELATDGVSEFGGETLVFIGTPESVARPPPFAYLGVGKALLFGTLDRLRFSQDALAFIAFSGPAPAHDHRREPAGLFRASGHRCIARRQKFEMAKVCAVQAQRTCIVHDQQVAGARTRRTRPISERCDHHEVRRAVHPRFAIQLRWRMAALRAALASLRSVRCSPSTSSTCAVSGAGCRHMPSSKRNG